MAKQNFNTVDLGVTAEDPAECVTDRGYPARTVLKDSEDARPLEEPDRALVIALPASERGQSTFAVAILICE